MEDKITTNELIWSLLGKYPQEKWDSILPIAIEWNKEAYNLEEKTLLELFDALKKMKKFIINYQEKYEDDSR